MARRHAPFLAALTALFALGACTAPTAATVGQATGTPDSGFGHIHGVDINPADGTVYAATHHGVFRLGPDRPTRVAELYQDTMGFAFTGPNQFLGSGHAGPDGTRSSDLGLITSSDGGHNWVSVALSGQADFHALSAAGATVYGFDSLTDTVMRSDDRGGHWQKGASFAVTALAVDPDNPMRVLSATPTELRESLDGGITFTALAPQPPRPLTMVDHISYVGGSDREPALAGVDTSGTVWSLGSAGWKIAGAVPGTPIAFTVIAPDRYLAATGTQVLGSEDAGRSWSVLAPPSG